MPCKNRSNSSADKPIICIRLVREVWPEVISIFDLGMFRDLDKNRTNSSFAAPSTGGALSLIFSVPSCSPAISVFAERGITRILKVMNSRFLAIFSNTLDVTPLLTHPARRCSGGDPGTCGLLQLASNENIEHERLQQADKDQNQHCRNIEHSDWGDKPLDRQHYRVRHFHHKSQKCFAREHKPLR